MANPPFSSPACATPLKAGEPPRVLLAEDNAIAGELLVMMARKLGMGMDWVENGLDAVDCVRQACATGRPYALLLLDAMMPVLSGPDAARRLRESGIDTAQLPIVAVTATCDPVEVRDMLASGMQAYLPKPVSIADLSACFDAWLPQVSQARGSMPDRSFDALRKRYDLRKDEIFAKLAEASGRGAFSADLRSELRDHLHKLAGTAGSFGEQALSSAAARGAQLLAESPPEQIEQAVEAAYALLQDAA